MQTYSVCLKMIVILFALSGCSTMANKASNANMSIAAPINSHALAFQADPSFGGTLSESEKVKLSAAEQKALEFGADGQSIRWAGSTPEASGTVTSFRPFRVGGSNCRRFEHKILVNSVRSDLAGTACRKGAGKWKLIQ